MTDSTIDSYSITGTAYSERITAGAGNDRLYDSAIVGIDEAIEAAKTTREETAASTVKGNELENISQRMVGVAARLAMLTDRHPNDSLFRKAA